MLTIQQPGVEGRASLWDVDDYRYEWDLRLNDDVSIEMGIDLGAGTADLKLDSLSLTQLGVNAGAGEVTVDLTGDRQVDLDAEIKGGAGKATVRLPREVGVRVNVEGGLYKINAGALKKDGDAYVNDAYGKSETTLRLDVTAGLGAIDLELGE